MLSPDSIPRGRAGRKRRCIPTASSPRGPRPPGFEDQQGRGGAARERRAPVVRARGTAPPGSFARAFARLSRRRRATTPEAGVAAPTPRPRPTARHAGSEPSLKQRVFTRARHRLLFPMRRNRARAARARRRSAAKADDPLPTFSLWYTHSGTRAGHVRGVRPRCSATSCWARRARPPRVCLRANPRFRKRRRVWRGKRRERRAGATRRYSHSASPPRNLFRFKTDAMRSPSASGGRRRSRRRAVPRWARTSRSTTSAGGVRRRARATSGSPFKVLDAPALQDDFYLNLVDWSSHNVLAVGWGPCVYLWSACTSLVTKLCDLGTAALRDSEQWTPRGTTGGGHQPGRAQIWDANKCKKVRVMGGHRTRVGALAWSSSTLSSGEPRPEHPAARRARARAVHRQARRAQERGVRFEVVDDGRELASGGLRQPALRVVRQLPAPGAAIRRPRPPR